MAQEVYIDQSGLALLQQRNGFCVCAFKCGDVMPKATVPMIECQIVLTVLCKLVNVPLQCFQLTEVMEEDCNLT